MALVSPLVSQLQHPHADDITVRLHAAPSRWSAALEGRDWVPFSLVTPGFYPAVGRVETLINVKGRGLI